MGRTSEADRKSRDPEYGYSQRDLAAKTDRSKAGIQKLAARGDWPFGNPIQWPVRVSDFERWADRTLVRGKQDRSGDDVDASSLQQLRAEKLYEEVCKLRAENERLAGRLVARDQVEREVSGLIHNLRSALMGFATAYADKLHAEGHLVDGARQKVQAFTEGEMETLLTSFADGASIALESLE